MTLTHDSAASCTVGDLRHEFSPVARKEIAQYIRGPATAVPVEELRPQPDCYPIFFEESQRILLRLEDEPGAVVTSPVLDLARDEVRILSWIMATLLGEPLIQNLRATAWFMSTTGTAHSGWPEGCATTRRGKVARYTRTT